MSGRYPKSPVWLRPPVEPFEVVAIAGSAGSFAALRTILACLPDDFPSPILITQHRGPDSGGVYPVVLQRATTLRVIEARTGDRLESGTVYVPPGGRHLEITRDGTIDTRRSGRIGGVQPSADVMFESVAAHYGARTVAVVLTGYGRDGARGVRAVRGCGGFVIAQDEASSKHFGMPAAAIETRRVDLVLPLTHIAFALTTLFAGERAAAGGPASTTR